MTPANVTILSSTRFVAPPHRPRRSARSMSSAARASPVASAAAASARRRATKHALASRRGFGVAGGHLLGTRHRVDGVRLGERYARDGGHGARLAPRADAPESPSSTAVSDVAEPSPPSPGADTAPVDPDAPPPLSPAAQKAVALVDRDVRVASASSADLARPSAPNTYLPKSAGGFSLPLPPEPVRFPRTKLNLRLAVLLLRSGYETIDAMDVLPMDSFQVKFWKARQAEWEPYKFQYAPLVIEQGKLEDPLYFDFISYVQFEVVAREMPNSASVFEERSGAEGTVKVVRRDPNIADNALLPAVLAQRLGDTIYARLRYGFEETTFPGCPEPARLDESVSLREDAAEDAETRGQSTTDALNAKFSLIQRGVAGLTKCMVDKGYGLRSDVSVIETRVDKRRQKLKIVVEGPANLWGAQALAARGVSPMNEYLGFAITAYCRASGVGSFYVSKATDVAVEIELTVTMP